MCVLLCFVCSVFRLNNKYVSLNELLHHFFILPKCMNSEQRTANESTQNNHKFIYFFLSLHSLHKINSKRFTNLCIKVFETRNTLYEHTCSLPSTRPFYITNLRKFGFHFVIVQFCSEKHSAHTRSHSYMEIFKGKKTRPRFMSTYKNNRASCINESQGQSR